MSFDKLMTDKARWSMAVKWTEKRIVNIDKIITGHGQILSVEDLKSFNDKILTKISEE